MGYVIVQEARVPIRMRAGPAAVEPAAMPAAAACARRGLLIAVPPGPFQAGNVVVYKHCRPGPPMEARSERYQVG
jgi:hypothetical protein